MNNDRELLELAAKAAGYKIKRWWTQTDGVEVAILEDGSYWQPLIENKITDCMGDALRLAVKLNLDINYDCCDRGVSVCVYGNYDKYTGEQCFEEFESTGLAATRRAIVRAAAEIGRANA